MRFRSKVVVIDAELFDRDKQHRLSDEFRAAVCTKPDIPGDWQVDAGGRIQPHIHTLEGWHEVSDGDWIIKGLKGEFYPCKPDVFEMKYERVETDVSRTERLNAPPPVESRR